jgi:hypothetical protein
MQVSGHSHGSSPVRAQPELSSFSAHMPIILFRDSHYQFGSGEIADDEARPAMTGPYCAGL